MSLASFITWIITGGGAGVIVFGAIRIVDNKWPLSSDVKFWAAIVLGVLVPLGAYSAEVALGLAQFGVDGLWQCALAAYAVSQAIHFQVKKAESAPAPMTPGEAQQIPKVG